MIFTQRQAREKIQSLESRIAELESESESKDQTIEQLRKDVSDASAESAPQSARIIELEEQVAGLDERIETLEAENKELSAKAEITQSAVAAAAVAEMATVGQENPFEISASAKDSKNEIIAKFQAMPAGEERSAFFHQHKSILSIKS
jgi:septal ring factor EnvC (AmiA/AmiB activator)